LSFWCGSRPPFRSNCGWSAGACSNELTVFIGNCGLVPTGYQPWAYLTVRRSAGLLSPPTQIGIGFCTGLGVNTTSSNFTYLLERSEERPVETDWRSRQATPDDKKTVAR